MTQLKVELLSYSPLYLTWLTAGQLYIPTLFMYLQTSVSGKENGFVSELSINFEYALALNFTKIL
jgi:hypothetical protein